MTPPPAAEAQDGGQFAANLVRFVRLLRGAGLPLGPEKVLDALAAVQAVGLARRDDFRAALQSVLVNRHEHLVIFHQAFALFWRNPGAGTQQLHSLLNQLGSKLKEPSRKPGVSARLAQAWWQNQGRTPQKGEEEEIERHASATLSARERLQHRDFADMTQQEMADARKAIAAMRVALPMIRTRRYRPQANGAQVDLRNSLRQMARSAPDLALLRHRAPARREAALLVLCDISGSMETYTRMLLHFLHAVSSDRSRVHSFLFGTRLTHVTRLLRDRDVDVALARIGQQVEDWGGGTRIGACLHEFNQRWGRRLLGQGAVVLLITDGLDSDDAQLLDAEMARLSRSCLQLVWLNPLLRYAGFEAKPAGIRAMLPHVDRMLPVHDLASMAKMASLLRRGLPAA